MTVENLLTHTSGFQAWKPFYLSHDSSLISEAAYLGDSDDEINKFVLREIAKTPLENPINSKVVYSDFNFLLLGFIWLGNDFQFVDFRKKFSHREHSEAQRN